MRERALLQWAPVKGLSGPWTGKTPLAQSSKNQKIALAAVKAAEKAISKPKKPKKKAFSWKSILGAAASTAVDLAPELLPLILATHAPSQAAVKNAPPGMVPNVGGAVGLAAGGIDISNMTGLLSHNVVGRDANGRITAIEVVTLDMLTTVDDAGYTAGEVMYEAWIQGQDPSCLGTKFALFVNQFERVKFLDVVFQYRATCAATNSGAITGCVFNDADTDVSTLGGGEALRVCASQNGSDTFQVYAGGMFKLPKVPGEPPKYTDPNGTDVRLCVGGKVVLLCAADIAAGFSPGQLFMLSRFRCEIPSLVDVSPAGASAYIADTTGWAPGGTTYAPWQNLSTDNEYLGEGGRFVKSQVYTISGTTRTGNCFVELSPGDYIINPVINGTVITSGITWFLTDEAQSYGCLQIFEFDTLQSNTRCSSTFAFSVAAGMPNDVPILACSMASTTITNAYIFIAKINEGCLENAGELLGRDKDNLTPLQRAKAVEYAKRKRLYARTQQGQQMVMKQQLASLTSQMRTIRDAPIGPACSSSSSSSPSAFPSVPASMLGAGRRQ